MITRSDRLKKLAELYGLSLDVVHNCGDEDIQEYFDPIDSKTIEKYAVITRSGEFAYIKADAQYMSEAEADSVANINDPIYSESPCVFVDLDTGQEYYPDWNSLVWKAVSNAWISR